MLNTDCRVSPYTWQKHNSKYDPVAEIVSYYKPLRAISQSIDIVAPTQYKFVVAPGLNVLSEAAAKNLENYVRQGGHLVLGQRSGMKDDDNALQTERQPGPLVNVLGGRVLGGRVKQYYALTDPVKGKFGSGESKLWAELLSAKGSVCHAVRCEVDDRGQRREASASVCARRRRRVSEIR